MSICVPHPNFGCLIWCCALFCQNASGVYTSGPGPWEVSPASSGTLWIMTVLYSSSRQELSAISPLYNTDPDPLDDEKEERRREGVEGRRDKWGNYNNGTVYMASELEGEAPKYQVLSSTAAPEVAWESASPLLHLAPPDIGKAC